MNPKIFRKILGLTHNIGWAQVQKILPFSYPELRLPGTASEWPAGIFELDALICSGLLYLLALKVSLL